MRKSRLHIALGLCLVASYVLLATMALAGCSTAQYRDRADREVYGLVEEKAQAVPGVVDDFDVSPQAPSPLEGLPVVEGAPEFLGDARPIEEGAAILSIERAIALAFAQNRDYLAQRELVYLTALDLTLERHRYTPIFAAGGSAAYHRTTTDVQKSDMLTRLAQESPDIVEQIGALTGQPADLVSSYANVVDSFTRATRIDQPDNEIRNERSVSGRTGVGVDLLLAGGARIAVDLTSNFLRFLTGDPRVATDSALVGTFTRPILRGGGRLVQQERLTQAERNLLYAIRDFTRFRQLFTVRVTSGYFRLLQDRDAIVNNYQSLLSFRRSNERVQALAEEGNATLADVGRQEQALLDAEDRWLRSIRAYSENLDAFKITLGLSTDAHVTLAPEELDALRDGGIAPIDIETEDAVRVALVSRLDLYTAHDETEDAERQVEIAADALKPGLDLVADARVDSMAGDRFQELDFQRASWSAGVDLDLALDRKAERNTYRSALIRREQVTRRLSLQEDEVKRDVRGAWRDLDQARRTYAIRTANVEINQRRVEEQELLAEIGRGTALDYVDALNELTGAQNAVTAALVDYTLARLELWRDMGMLYVKKDGQWEELRDVEP